jgi:tRNA (cmo5U34)-methyltransferase
VTSKHEHGHGHGHAGHEHGHADQVRADQGHGHGHQHGDWADEDFVAGWLERDKERAPRRRRQFTAVRACIPKNPGQEFRYLNLGAGPGNLDVLLLEHFTGANAVVLDGSLTMLAAARKELARFGSRVEYVHADLATPEWTGGVTGPFDFVVSAHTIHHVTEPQRIRQLYREVRELCGHGGTFLNLDFVRPARAELVRLAEWVSRDEEAGFPSSPHDAAGLPGTLIEHLGWLGEVGFSTVEVYWKEMDLALIAGINGHLHMPWGHGDDPATGPGHEHGSGHEHGHGH